MIMVSTCFAFVEGISDSITSGFCSYFIFDQFLERDNHVLPHCLLLPSEDYDEDMSEGLEERMTVEGEVSAVTSSYSCTTAGNGGFASSDSSGSSNVPFSTWNLNSYDFSDWFLLLFILFSGCFLCFGCGYAMHRRRVLKALEDLSVEQLQDNEDDEDAGDEIGMVPTNYTTKVSVNTSVPVHNAAPSYGDAVMTPNEPEIEIGVSVNQSKMGLLN